MARAIEKTEITAAQRRLAAALPPQHPVAKEVRGLLDRLWEDYDDACVALEASQFDTAKANNTIASHAVLLDVLEDFRRGIRDWAEVEIALKQAGFAKREQEDPA